MHFSLKLICSLPLLSVSREQLGEHHQTKQAGQQASSGVEGDEGPGVLSCAGNLSDLL
jgi:hypothetical protein